VKREPIEENLPKVNVKTPRPKVKPPKNRVELERDDYYENLKIADKKIIDLERKLKIAEDFCNWILTKNRLYSDQCKKAREALSAIREE